MTPEERKELNRQKRAEKNKAKMALERQRKREKQLKNADKEKEKAKRELEAMNNIVIRDEPKAEKVREKFQQRAKSIIGSSRNNKKWEKKRKERYNQRVWRGWRESDGKESPVTSYNIKDLEGK